MEWAWHPPSLNPHERLTLLNLAWRLNQMDGRCFPSLRLIAQDTGISRRGVQDCLKSLETKGIVRRVPRYVGTGVMGRASNGYILPALTKIKSPYQKFIGGAGAAAASGVASVVSGGKTDASGGEGSAHEQGSKPGMEQGSNSPAPAPGKAKDEEQQVGGKQGGATVAIAPQSFSEPVEEKLTLEQVIAIMDACSKSKSSLVANSAAPGT